MPNAQLTNECKQSARAVPHNHSSGGIFDVCAPPSNAKFSFKVAYNFPMMHCITQSHCGALLCEKLHTQSSIRVIWGVCISFPTCSIVLAQNRCRDKHTNNTTTTNDCCSLFGGSLGVGVFFFAPTLSLVPFTWTNKYPTTTTSTTREKKTHNYYVLPASSANK